MTEEQINIAIAEACGWTEIGLVDTLCGIHPEMKSLKAYDGGPLDYPRWQIPNYCNDLNAMHKAEKILKLGLRNTYDAELGLLAERDYCFIWETTARQRAEAFLKTLNKWEGTPIQ